MARPVASGESLARVHRLAGREQPDVVLGSGRRGRQRGRAEHEAVRATPHDLSARRARLADAGHPEAQEVRRREHGTEQLGAGRGVASRGGFRARGRNLTIRLRGLLFCRRGPQRRIVQRALKLQTERAESNDAHDRGRDGHAPIPAQALRAGGGVLDVLPLLRELTLEVIDALRQRGRGRQLPHLVALRLPWRALGRPTPSTTTRPPAPGYPTRAARRGYA